MVIDCLFFDYYYQNLACPKLAPYDNEVGGVAMLISMSLSIVKLMIDQLRSKVTKPAVMRDLCIHTINHYRVGVYLT